LDFGFWSLVFLRPRRSTPLDPYHRTKADKHWGFSMFDPYHHLYHKRTKPYQHGLTLCSATGTAQRTSPTSLFDRGNGRCVFDKIRRAMTFHSIELKSGSVGEHYQLQTKGSDMNAINETTSPSETRSGSAAAATSQELLASHPFFIGLDPHQARLMQDCAMAVSFEPGELIFKEGDPANRFYLIHQGEVALESYVKDRGITLIQTVGPGEVLGWSWLFPPYYWHFDARAVEPVKATFIYGTPLREECEGDHDLGYELMKRMAAVMMQRLQETRRQLLNLRGFCGKSE
jgi:CRP/FNR family cyclic AMP-dependent transcriptional regulator